MNISALTSGVIVLLEGILALGLLRMLLKEQVSKHRVFLAGVFISAMLLLAAVQIKFGIVLPGDMNGVVYFMMILLLVGVYGILMYFSPLRVAFVNLSTDSSLALQGLRVLFGANFLIQGAFGVLPLGAGLVHGIMHVLTGVLCLYAALVFLQSKPARNFILVANLFGIIDILVTAFDISFVSFEAMGLRHGINYAVFFAAPLYFWLHIFSILQTLGIFKKKS